MKNVRIPSLRLQFSKKLTFLKVLFSPKLFELIFYVNEVYSNYDVFYYSYVLCCISHPFFINDCLFFCPLHCPSHTVRDATAGCHGVCDHLSYFICPAGSTVVITVVEVLEC